MKFQNAKAPLPPLCAKANNRDIDWRGAVAFRDKVVAQAADGSLWQLGKDSKWYPLIVAKLVAPRRKGSTYAVNAFWKAEQCPTTQ